MKMLQKLAQTPAFFCLILVWLHCRGRIIHVPCGGTTGDTEKAEGKTGGKTGGKTRETGGNKEYR